MRPSRAGGTARCPPAWGGTLPRGPSAASDLAAVVQAQKAARAKPRQPQRRLVPTGPKRRSGRIQGERPIYNEDVLARIMTDDDRRRPGAAAAARELRGGAGENPGYGYVELVGAAAAKTNRDSCWR